MKNINIKNLVAMGILMSVFMFGTQAAQAGFLISDRSATSGEPQPCQEEEDDVISRVGLIISDFAKTVTTSVTGILISDRSGILISDRNGILISDRDGDGKDDGCQEKQ